MRSRKLSIMVAAAALFAVFIGFAVWGASESARAANLAQENAGLKADLVVTQDALVEALEKLDALTFRISVLESEIRRLGGQVPDPDGTLRGQAFPEPPPTPTTTVAPTSTVVTTTTESPRCGSNPNRRANEPPCHRPGHPADSRPGRRAPVTP